MYRLAIQEGAEAGRVIERHPSSPFPHQNGGIFVRGDEIRRFYFLGNGFPAAQRYASAHIRRMTSSAGRIEQASYG